MPVKKEVKILGSNVKGKNIFELLKKLKTKKSDNVKVLRDLPFTKEGNDELTKIAFDNNGNMGKIDIRNDKPTLLRNFGIKYIQKSKIVDAVVDDVKFNNVTLGDLPDDHDVKIILHLTMWIVINNFYLVKRYHSFNFTTNQNVLKNIKNDVKIIATQYIHRDYPEGSKLAEAPFHTSEYEYNGVHEDVTENPSYIIQSQFSKQKFELIDGKLRDDNPLDISNIWVNIDLNANKDCAIAYMVTRTKIKKLLKLIHELGDENGVTAREIYEFCKEHDIECSIFEYNGELKLENIPEKKRRGVKKFLFMFYNNHCYPLTDCFKPVKNKSQIEHIQITKNATKLINKIITDDKRMVANISYDGEKVISFVDKKVKYLQNDEYEKCKKILESYELEDKINDNIKITSLLKIIEKKYIEDNVNSFFPESSKYCKGGYTYKTSKKYNKKDVVTIDKNKMYAHCLKSLPFLISVDIRSCKINYNPKGDIIGHHLYLARPQKHSILLPNTNIYSGEHLIYSGENGLKFNVLVEFESNKHLNFYTQLINDLYDKVDNNTFKNIMVRGIGYFEKETSSTINYENVTLYNKDEVKRRDGYIDDTRDYGIDECFKNEDYKIDGRYKLMYDVSENVGNVTNKKPIAIQIKDMSRRVLYEKMEKLKITEDNLIEINTDSISYIGDLPSDLNKDKLDGWKQIRMRDIKNDESEIYDNEVDENILSKKFNGTLIDAGAGTGKTHYSINKIIPKHENSYMVLTPSHKSLKEYRENKINCGVIQKYTLSNTIPEEQTIIVDEYGMCNQADHNMLFKCAFLGKKLYFLGDKHQLPPINGEKLNNKEYIEMMFSEVKVLSKNYRNHFTNDYYYSLIDSKDKNYLRGEVIKHSTKNYDESEYIICYKIETVKKYNELMMKKLKYNWNSKGLKVICCNNKLSKDELYNGFIYTITDSNNDFITLDDHYTIKVKDYKKCFKPAYAITLHKIQGQSIKSYYYAPEDYSFITPSVAYVTISRLKTK
jgi:hypothetical protein